MLGSRSTDLLSGLGPAPLADGAVLPLGPAPPPGTARYEGALARRAAGGGAEGAVRAAGRLVRPGALRTLTSRAYRVSPASNRVGLRTEGRRWSGRGRELPSEGMVLGAVQVPPDGRPVVFLADHPTTGGYPVVAVVREADLAVAAQAAPGTPVRFVRGR